MFHAKMYIFYPIIIVLGLFTSYTDIKFRKIRNKHLLFAAVTGLIVYTYLIINQKFILDIGLASNLLLGLGIGLLLYLTDTWGAGDAKLFAVFCLLMPTEKYSYILPFASIAVFICTFVLSLIAMLIFSIGHSVKTKTKIFNKIFLLSVLERLGISFGIIISVSWIIRPLLQNLIPKTTFFLYVVVMYSVYHILYTVLYRSIKNWHIGFIVFSFGFLTRLYFQPSDFIGVNMLATLKRTFLYCFTFACLRTILEKDKSNNDNEKHMPFAPFIFLGTLLANTNFLNSLLDILRILRR